MKRVSDSVNIFMQALSAVLYRENGVRSRATPPSIHSPMHTIPVTAFLNEHSRFS